MLFFFANANAVQPLTQCYNLLTKVNRVFQIVDPKHHVPSFDHGLQT